MVEYIDTHRHRFGVGPICTVLRAALAGGFLTARAYWQVKARAASRMRARHETLARDIMVIHAHRFMAVYGYRKVHRQLIRRGWRGIGRDQVLHVMLPQDPGGASGTEPDHHATRQKHGRQAGPGEQAVHHRGSWTLARGRHHHRHDSRPARSRMWRSSPTRTPQGSWDGPSPRASTPGRCPWSRWTSPSAGQPGTGGPQA